MSISRQRATELIASVLTHAEETEYSFSVAVVDDAGFLVSFQRDDDGRIPNIELAIEKARTAARWERPTRLLTELLQPGAAGYTIQHTDPDVVAVDGGLPILDDEGTVLGAISADGGPPDVDEALCERALAEHGYRTAYESPID